MSRIILSVLLLTGLFAAGACPAAATELKPADVSNPKGDGPDGKGNTSDDAWQFWFELAHAPGKFERLDLATATLSPDQRKDGMPRKVRGPIAGLLPNPADSNGWIFHRDWDGRFEGIWADGKTGAVLAHPYAEKKSHCAVAITYRVPRSGAFTVSGKLTDVSIAHNPPHDGILWRLEQVSATNAVTLLERGGPIGDGQGRQDAASFRITKAVLKEGDLLRLVIHPNRWWGADLTRIDEFTIQPVEHEERKR